MALCELCNKFGSAKMKYDLDSARMHAEKHYLQLHIVDVNVAPVEIFEKCFPAYQQASERRETLARKLNLKSLRDLCYSLFSRKRILDLPSHIACAKCGVKYKLLLGTQKNLNTTAIIDHACSHLDEKELFACLHCSRQYQTYGAVRSHLTKLHRFSSVPGHFENKCHKFVKEISAQIRSCFGPNNKKVNSDGVWASNASKIRRRHAGTEVGIERQQLCQQLTRKIADRDKSIKCHLCSSRLSVNCKGRTTTWCHSAMQHVLLHLQKPTKRCRICFEVFASRHTMYDHLTDVHSLPLARNYDCLADEFHTEIMVLLQKCYGTNFDGKRNESGLAIAPKSAKAISKKGTKLSIERKLMCHRVIRKFANHEKQLQCRLCSSWINAKLPDGLYRSEHVMQHAFRHMAKPLYRCKRCSSAFTYSDSMRNHLRVMHAQPLSNNYACFQDEHHSGIISILRECYGDERDGGLEKE